MKSNAMILLALLSAMQQVYAGDNCFRALKYEVEFQPIGDKVALAGGDILTFGNEQTFSMLANDSYPTSDEKQAIYKWAIKREQCVKNLPRANPFQQIAVEAHEAVQFLVLDLYKGSISYGQFARQRQEINSTAATRAQNLFALTYGQQQQQQRQQQQSQPKPYVPPRATQSTCGWQGNQWVCDTRPSGIDWGILQNR